MCNTCGCHGDDKNKDQKDVKTMEECKVCGSKEGCEHNKKCECGKEECECKEGECDCDGKGCCGDGGCGCCGDDEDEEDELDEEEAEELAEELDDDE